MIIYDIFFFIFSLVYLPYLAIKSKAHKDFLQRFGKLPASFRGIGASRPIWIHAVSVGEVAAVKNFIEALSSGFPRQKIVLSTTTKTGNEMANKILKGDVLKFYFPLDFTFVVKRVINLIKPSVFAVMETEIWPNLILELSRKKIPIMLLNGRISDKSFKGYKKIKFFFGSILKRINVFCMQTTEDAQKIEALGAAKESIKVTGNMKFDVDDVGAEEVFGNRPPATGAVAKMVTEMVSGSELIIAGSTHRGEDEIIVDAYRKILGRFQNVRLLLAPRHIDRSSDIKKMVEGKGLKAVLISHFSKGEIESISKNAVLILDTLGELGRLYSLASVVFMGGSLVKRGGHNLVEPALFRKAMLFGPHMFNFRAMARTFLEGRAAILVKNEKELIETLESLLSDKEKRGILGRNAGVLIDRSKGATAKNLSEMARFISEPKTA